MGQYAVVVTETFHALSRVKAESVVDDDSVVSLNNIVNEEQV